MFAEVGIGPFTQNEAQDHLAEAVTVLVVGDPPVGFASIEIVDGVAHLAQLAVHPSEGRRGLGTTLVTVVCQWAQAQGYEAVTLTTFLNVAWNAPFYRRMGFRVLEELSPGLTAIRQHEKDIGDDDFGPRVAMRRDLESPSVR
jgi:GNAT superfamily N-acetyltransferase